jgi:hypothetical protein
MMNKIIVFILLFTLSFSVSAQTFLVLEKMGTKKRYEFHAGEQMEIKLNNDDYFTRITILGLRDSIVSAENQEINLSTINAVKLNNKSSFLKYSGPLLAIAGVALFSFDAINQTLVQGGSYTFSPGVAVASASLIGLGAAFTFAGRDKVKVKKWWRLRIVQI